MGAAARSRPPPAEGCSSTSQAPPLGCGAASDDLDAVFARLRACPGWNRCYRPVRQNRAGLPGAEVRSSRPAGPRRAVLRRLRPEYHFSFLILHFSFASGGRSRLRPEYRKNRKPSCLRARNSDLNIQASPISKGRACPIPQKCPASTCVERLLSTLPGGRNRFISADKRFFRFEIWPFHKFIVI